MILRESLAIETNLTNVDGSIGITMSANRKCFAVADVDSGFLNNGTTQLITSTARLHLIESHSREQIPSRHLTNVLITAKTGWLIIIKFGHDLTSTLLRLPRLTHIIIHIYNVVAGLITVSILTNQSRDVGISIFAQVAISLKESIEALDEGGQVTLYFLENCQGDKQGASSWSTV